MVWGGLNALVLWISFDIGISDRYVMTSDLYIIERRLCLLASTTKTAANHLADGSHRSDRSHRSDVAGSGSVFNSSGIDHISDRSDVAGSGSVCNSSGIDCPIPLCV